MFGLRLAPLHFSSKDFEILDLDPPNNPTSHYGACHFGYYLALKYWYSTWNSYIYMMLLFRFLQNYRLYCRTCEKEEKRIIISPLSIRYMPFNKIYVFFWNYLLQLQAMSDKHYHSYVYTDTCENMSFWFTYPLQLRLHFGSQ